MEKKKATAGNIPKNIYMGPRHNIKALIIGVVCLILLVFLRYSGLQPYLAVALAISVLIVTGQLIVTFGFPAIMPGVFLLPTKDGLGIMDSISKRFKGFWIALADWGLVLTFGLLCPILFKKQLNKRTLLFGLASIAALLYFMGPALYVPISFVNIPNLNTQALAQAAASPLYPYTPSVYQYLLIAISVLGGFLLELLILLILITAVIVYEFSLTFISLFSPVPNYGPINNAVSGVAPLLPGITLPFTAGILSIAFVLIVHEFSHGVLSRILKIKLRSMGLMLFGIIVVGAFVEPDEAAIAKLGAVDQRRIFIAGISMNMLFSFVFLAMLVFMVLSVAPKMLTTRMTIQAISKTSTAYGVINPGDAILKWNNYQLKNYSSLQVIAANQIPFSNVSIITDKGSYVFRTNATGKVGLSGFEQVSVPINNSPSTQALYFLYTFIALAFLINFALGNANMLPIGIVDGGRIFRTFVKNKKVVKAFVIVIAAALIINLIVFTVGFIHTFR